MPNEDRQPDQPLTFGCNYELGPLPEPRMWYDHATQKCHGMALTCGTHERLWDACDMQAYAAAAVAVERERCAKLAEGQEAGKNTRLGPEGVGTFDDRSALASVMRALAKAIRAGA